MRRRAATSPISSSSATCTARSTKPGAGPRMIVLGGWQYRSSYLKIDEAGASFHVTPAMPQEAVRLADREMEKLKIQD